MTGQPDKPPASDGHGAVAQTEGDAFVVGVGASAGGLEALRDLARNLPRDIAASYVVAQHMAPQHKSLLTTLIARETALDVQDVRDGVRPAANTIYVTPPNHDVVFADGALWLKAPGRELAAPKPSVDRFLISLAEAVGERAVGVILSGTGSDGAYGVQAIRAAGGITIAQDDQTAKYDGMPVAAQATGCVDLVLSPVEIGAHLSKILASPRTFGVLTPEGVRETPLTDLLQILLARTRVDFRDYKPTTLQRRIERRMTALNIHAQTEYTHHCRANPREVDALFKDLLISVTRFFRDPEEFAALQERIVRMVEGADAGPIRVWVTGCATGEEAYSIAILLAEAMGGPEHLNKDRLQIFATDIDEAALKVAREGKYSLAAIDDLPAAYVEKYFVTHDDGVRVASALKEIILFSRHDVCQDPPFLTIDLICCRNVLIYFNQALQSRVMARFHYALNADGVLFLGTAETIAGSEALFRHDGGRAHIYRKRVISQGDPPRRATPFADIGPMRRHGARSDSAAPSDSLRERALFDGLARTLGPDGLLLTGDMRIARVYGDISPFVTLTEATRLSMCLNMLAAPLANEARTLTMLAQRHGAPRSGQAHRLNGRDGIVQLQAYPVSHGNLDEAHTLLIIAARPDDDGPGQPVDLSRGDAGDHIALLQREVDSTHKELGQVVGELETSNEELQSLNEELQSTNEELQATNEELELSNEELQSSNEELITVNEQAHISASELLATTEELSSVLENIAIPVMVVDTALQISRASKAAIAMFAIQAPSEKPHISQCALPAGFPRLAEICNACLRLGDVSTQEILTDDSAFTLRCAPYADATGRLSGVTLVFMERPSALRNAETLQAVMDNAPLIVLHLTRRGDILRLSGEAARLFGCTTHEAQASNIAALVDAETADRLIADNRVFLDGPSDSEVVDLRLRRSRKQDMRWFQMERWRAHDDALKEDTVFLTGVDITDRRAQENALQVNNAQLELAQSLSGIGYWTIDLARDTLFWSARIYEIHGLNPASPPPSVETAINFYHTDDRPAVRAMIDAALRDGEAAGVRLRLVRTDDRLVHVEARCKAQYDSRGGATHLFGVFRELPDAADLTATR